MADQPMKAAISAQVNALECRHFAQRAEVRMRRADQRALRQERQAAGQHVSHGVPIWRLGALRIVIDEAAEAPTVVCRVPGCAEGTA